MRSKVQKQRISKGAVLLRQGEAGDDAYVVKSGTLQVYIAQNGIEVPIATLGPGDIVGEMALLYNAVRCASVRATSDCELVILDKQSVLKTMDDSAPLVKSMMKVLSERVRRTNTKVVKAVCTAKAKEEARENSYQPETQLRIIKKHRPHNKESS